ncbi:aspartate kinase [Alloiococcus sp. CFN-8]|uniref:aspartate kinase n=1 Tax=Alloiococcus sp. CFN-8 TaxID=3416081 RepID=UPI003CF465AE
MNTKVLKFGGSSLADAAHFKKVGQIIREEKERKYVVVSAPGKRHNKDEKVTDLLYQCYDLAVNNQDITPVFLKIEARYNEIIDGLSLKLSLAKEYLEIKNNIISTKSKDYAASRGEYLNGIILANYMGFTFVDPKDMILFNEDGILNPEGTDASICSALKAIEYAVIPGFYGSLPDGSIKTFSRGGSDVTGSMVAKAVKASLYENWTDVSGVLMADPRIVKNPKVIETLTYKELRELSYMGTTVLHEDATLPVRSEGIPINIRNTNSPEDKGTMIIPTYRFKNPNGIITGIAGKTGFTTIIIEKDMMNGELGIGNKILEVLAKNSISFEHVPSSIDALSVIVNSKDLEEKEEFIIHQIIKAVKPDSIMIEDGLALVAVVGHNMVRAKGTAARVFTAIAKADINIKMIDQGASELNIIVGVEEKDYKNTIKAIYNEFVNN